MATTASTLPPAQMRREQTLVSRRSGGIRGSGSTWNTSSAAPAILLRATSHRAASSTTAALGVDQENTRLHQAPDAPG